MRREMLKRFFHGVRTKFTKSGKDTVTKIADRKIRDEDLSFLLGKHLQNKMPSVYAANYTTISTLAFGLLLGFQLQRLAATRLLQVATVHGGPGGNGDPLLFYKLALQRRPDDAHKMSIHGLWIQRIGGKQFKLESHKSLEILKLPLVFAEYGKDLVKYWPSKEGDQIRFLVRQWIEHGQYTKLGPMSYFGETLELYKKLAEDPSLGLSRGNKNADDVAEHLSNVVLKAYGTKAYPQIACEPKIDQIGNRLIQEIRICFEIEAKGKPGKPVDCPKRFRNCKHSDNIFF